jgi:hypothetical protein
VATGFPFDISYAGGTTSRSLWCDASTPSFYACPDVPEQLAPLVAPGSAQSGLPTGLSGSGSTGPWFAAGSFNG